MRELDPAAVSRSSWAFECRPFAPLCSVHPAFEQSLRSACLTLEVVEISLVLLYLNCHWNEPCRAFQYKVQWQVNVPCLTASPVTRMSFSLLWFLQCTYTVLHIWTSGSFLLCTDSHFPFLPFTASEKSVSGHWRCTVVPVPAICFSVKFLQFMRHYPPPHCSVRRIVAYMILH